MHGKASGYIRHIYVGIGDQVRQGQTLAVLEVPELTAEVAGAQAGVSQAQQNIARLQNEVTREQASSAAVHANYLRLKQASDQLETPSSAHKSLICDDDFRAPRVLRQALA